MRTLEVQELEDRITEVLRQVQETGETVALTKDGEVIAHLVPLHRPQPPVGLSDNDIWANLNRLSAEISAHWPEGVSAVDAIRDVRREL